MQERIRRFLNEYASTEKPGILEEAFLLELLHQEDQALLRNLRAYYVSILGHVPSMITPYFSKGYLKANYFLIRATLKLERHVSRLLWAKDEDFFAQGIVASEAYLLLDEYLSANLAYFSLYRTASTPTARNKEEDFWEKMKNL